MAVLPILRLGHPLLRSASEPVPPSEFGTAALERLVDDLVETMRAARGAGLAAPQVGVSRQIFVLGAGPEDLGADTLVVCNPLLTLEGHELVFDWEGCLSIPDLRGLVPRHPALRLQGFDSEGKPLDRRFEGFLARVVQHEYDHLNGVVFLDRMRDLHSLAFRDEWLEHLVSRAPGASAA